MPTRLTPPARPSATSSAPTPAAETCWREASGAVVGADVPLVDLYAVQVVGPTQAWAVGAEGVVIRWDGTRWRLQTALGGAALRGLVILDEQTGWAVGDGGRILRYQ